MPKPWRPVLASATKCCTAEDAVVAPDGLAWCRPQQSELSRRLASFRRLSSLANSPASSGTTTMADKDGSVEQQQAAASLTEATRSGWRAFTRCSTHCLKGGMEYAAGGELFEWICNAGRFSKILLPTNDFRS
ncbi:uncharacterized protein [Miscanthus floridulus]|uniref:uncharacterized protein isoform X2 n=1 Tax=Miscanthus floridulus TaxID=154761 RepID=UPI00345AA595